MLLSVKIRLTRPLLGERRYGDNVRRFKKTRDGKIDIDPAHWNWAFSQAASSLHLAVDYSALSPALGLVTPSLVLYNRRFTARKEGKEINGSEMHEAVSAGTLISFELAVLECLGKKEPAPSQEQTAEMLSFVGSFVGISQWGNKFGYGRFDLESLDLK